MTAQVPERIILDGRPRALYVDPLYPLRERCRIEFGDPHVWNTANHRGYIGTWEICGSSLCLAHLCRSGRDSEEPMPHALRRRLFRASQCNGFPIPAWWFTGVLRIAIGKRLVYSHDGWSHWFERERVIHIAAGEIIRDREVDTRAILEWRLRRHPEVREQLGPGNPNFFRPFAWFDDDDGSDWEADGGRPTAFGPGRRPPKGSRDRCRRITGRHPLDRKRSGATYKE